MDKEFKDSAQDLAEASGFSSLQDFIRFMLNQYLNKKFVISVVSQEPDEILTPAQEAVLMKKVAKAKKELAAGKGVTVSSVDEMMKYLRS